MKLGGGGSVYFFSPCGGIFATFFSLCGGFFHNLKAFFAPFFHVGAFLVCLFSPFKNLSATFFSMSLCDKDYVGALLLCFSPYRGLFLPFKSLSATFFFLWSAFSHLLTVESISLCNGTFL